MILQTDNYLNTVLYKLGQAQHAARARKSPPPQHTHTLKLLMIPVCKILTVDLPRRM